MGALTKSQERLTLTTSFLGILQGTAWAVMSLICIIEYLNSKDSLPPDLPTSSSSYMEFFNFYLYMYLLYGNIKTPDNIINPDTFVIFMWIYFFSSFIWMVLSTMQLFFMHRTDKQIINIMQCWGVITALISCIDFLLVVLLGVEYNDYCLPNIGEDFCIRYLIPVLIIAARGFILWIVNVVFVYVTYKIVKSVGTGKNLNRKLCSADTQIPRATLQPASPGNTDSVFSYEESGSVWGSSPKAVTFGSRIPSTNTNPYQYQQQSSYNDNRNDNYWSRPRPTPYYPRQQQQMARY